MNAIISVLALHLRCTKTWPWGICESLYNTQTCMDLLWVYVLSIILLYFSQIFVCTVVRLYNLLISHSITCLARGGSRGRSLWMDQRDQSNWHNSPKVSSSVDSDHTPLDLTFRFLVLSSQYPHPL